MKGRSFEAAPSTSGSRPSSPVFEWIEGDFDPAEVDRQRHLVFGFEDCEQVFDNLCEEPRTFDLPTVIPER